jgi:UDP-N-acetylglucosamine--N-acetylmuramyl-(pentapeptide) pyrophosphoryl-undecaprenol N-acetylglucosamine transferase
MTQRILIAGGGTGGHLMPALAIAGALKEVRPDLEPVLIGAHRGIESQILPARPYRYHLLPVEPIYRRQWWKNFRWPLIAFTLLRQMNRIMAEEQPALVVGTGGYASGPMVWLAARRGIPTAIQEQNAFPGVATRQLAKRVRHVYLGLPEARGLLAPGRRTEIFETGNPIVPPDLSRGLAAREKFKLMPWQKVLLVTGGSQGSLAINQAIAGWIDSGESRDVAILWATGRGTYQQFAQYHRPPKIQVFDFLDPMSDAMAAADLVVARAGAITIAEICAWGRPSILIPLPTAAADHQTHNAVALAAAGASRHLPQSMLTVEALGTTITTTLLRDDVRAAMRAAASARGRPEAARQIATHLLGLLPSGSGASSQSPSLASSRTARGV